MYIYAEYGLTRRITLTASIPYSVNTYSQTGSTSTAKGFGDGEFGVRYYLGNINFKFYSGITGTLIVPLYANTADNNLGFQAFGLEAKYSGSGSGKFIGDNNFYYSVELAGRQYFSEFGPTQLKLTLSSGFNFTKTDQFGLATSAIQSWSINKSFSENLTQNRNFAYWQATARYGHTFERQLSIFFNYSRFLMGRSTGIGNNFSILLSRKF